MSVESTLLPALSKIGKVDNIARVREARDSSFIPNSYPVKGGPENARCSVSFIRRIEGSEVVRFSIRSDAASFELDTETLLRAVSKRNAHTVFGSVNLHSARNGEASEYEVVASHSLAIQGLTEEVVVEVVKQLLRLWQSTLIDIQKRITAQKVRQEVKTRQLAERSVVRQIVEDAMELEGKLRKQSLKEKKLRDQQLVLDRIDAMVGLQSVKEFAHGLVLEQQLTDLRRSFNFSTPTVSQHLVFMGDPGTGKTTVARLIGDLYKSLGLLSQGHVVEVDRSSLIGGYIGQSAMKTKLMCEKALGGVLFIDEAYSLSVDGRDYGDEALATILTFMENNRGNIAVIVAGYPKEMNAMLDSNPGLRSRFDTTIHFDNYGSEDLMKMFFAEMESQKYIFSDSATADIAYHFAQATQSSERLNARSIRKFVSEVTTQHAKTLLRIENPTRTQVTMVTSLSIPQEWVIGRPILGFEFESDLPG